MMLNLFVFIYQTIISPIQESNTQRYLIVQQAEAQIPAGGGESLFSYSGRHSFQSSLNFEIQITEKVFKFQYHRDIGGKFVKGER